MVARYGASIAVGAAVTFGLLFIMQLLIETGRGALSERNSFPDIEFVRVERPPEPEPAQTKPERPPEAKRPPETPTPNEKMLDNTLAVAVAHPTPRTGIQIGGPGIGISDGDYLPIVMVEPVYPARALQRGLEGYVVVEYTVTRAGTTRDVVVLESSSSLFERAAVESARKYKYRPRVIDGEPVEVPGVQTIIRFRIEE